MHQLLVIPGLRLNFLVTAQNADHTSQQVARLQKLVLAICLGSVVVNLWQREQQFIVLISEMMKRGVRVDVPFSRKKLAMGDAELHRIIRELGGRKPSGNNLKIMLIDELGLPVVRRTPQGKPSFDKLALIEYDEMLEHRNNPLAQHIRAYRGWQKTTSTNYSAYLKLLSPDGRLRCHYNLHGARTGRLSCSDPNLQNIPKLEDESSKKPWNYDVKHAFIPENGYTLLEVDFSQIEFRLAAAYADEESLLEIFNTPGSDIFKNMSEALGYPRVTIKTKVYAGNYGAQPKKIASILGISLQEADNLFRVYNAEYPKMFRLAEDVNEKAKRSKYITYWTGRRRHFQNPYEARKAFNSLLQGGGAEIVKSAMIRVFNEIDGPDCRMLLQVHDSIVFEIKTSRLNEFQERIVECMSRVTADTGMYASHALERVIFPVEAKVWGA